MTLYSSARALDQSPGVSLTVPGQPLLQHLTLQLPATAWPLRWLRSPGLWGGASRPWAGRCWRPTPQPLGRV